MCDVSNTGTLLGQELMDKRAVLEISNRVYDSDYVNRSVVDMGLVTEDNVSVKDNSIEVAYGLMARCVYSVPPQA